MVVAIVQAWTQLIPGDHFLYSHSWIIDELVICKEKLDGGRYWDVKYEVIR